METVLTKISYNCNFYKNYFVNNTLLKENSYKISIQTRITDLILMYISRRIFFLSFTHAHSTYPSSRVKNIPWTSIRLDQEFRSASTILTTDLLDSLFSTSLPSVHLCYLSISSITPFLSYQPLLSLQLLKMSLACLWITAMSPSPLSLHLCHHSISAISAKFRPSSFLKIPFLISITTLLVPSVT